MSKTATDGMMSTAAIALAKKGFAIFPLYHPIIDGDAVRCSCGKGDCDSVGKHPRTKAGLKDATTDEITILEWWKKWPDANIGIATGAINKLVALDIDARHGGDESFRDLQDAYGEFPESAETKTGDGIHLFMAHPGQRVPNSSDGKGWLKQRGLDIRGDGGYVIAPPSLHKSGKRYSWQPGAALGEISLAAMPGWLLAMKSQSEDAKKQPAPAKSVGLPAYFEKAIADECAAVALANEGTRNDQLNRSAFALGQFIPHGVSRNEIESRLIDAAGRCGLKGSEINRTVKSGLDDGEKQPRQISEFTANTRKGKAASQRVQEQAVSLVVVNLGGVEARPTKWLWDGRIPFGYITLLVGRPGEGKSFFTIDLASRVSTGSPWPDGNGFAPLGSVLFISLEDSEEMIRLRADAHHADASNLSIAFKLSYIGKDGRPEEFMFSLSHVAALEDAVKKIADLKLIVIDPIGSVLGGDTDAHRDNEVRSVLAPLAALADKYNVAVLVVAHRRKNGGSHADDLALGSRAFTGIARVVWHLSRDTENKSRRLLLPGKE